MKKSSPPSAGNGPLPPGIRWTIGDVSPRGFEALRLSLWGAWRLFGPDAPCAVVVNTLPVEEARGRTGTVPPGVDWLSARALPPALAARLDAGMAEGVAWKFAPLRVFPDRPELALDNDVILWDLPDALAAWLDAPDDGVVLAADVRPAFGRFEGLCREAAGGIVPLNTGIRGLPAGFDLEGALAGALDRVPGPLTSELDEQGLQVAALLRSAPCRIVRLDEVPLCSPFWPLRPEPGRCGAHFVGLNARHIPWNWYDRPATLVRAEHWDGLSGELHRRVGLPPPLPLA